MKSAELVSQKEANIEQLVEADEAKDADLQLTETRASVLEVSLVLLKLKTN
jgi:hypothetical protein